MLAEHSLDRRSRLLGLVQRHSLFTADRSPVDEAAGTRNRGTAELDLAAETPVAVAADRTRGIRAGEQLVQADSTVAGPGRTPAGGRRAADRREAVVVPAPGVLVERRRSQACPNESLGEAPSPGRESTVSGRPRNRSVAIPVRSPLARWCEARAITLIAWVGPLLPLTGRAVPPLPGIRSLSTWRPRKRAGPDPRREKCNARCRTYPAALAEPV